MYYPQSSNADTLKKILQALINEILNLLKTRVTSWFSLPTLVQNIINMEACKGIGKIHHNSDINFVF